jgi:hypothetical protein
MQVGDKFLREELRCNRSCSWYWTLCIRSARAEWRILLGSMCAQLLILGPVSHRRQKKTWTRLRLSSARQDKNGASSWWISATSAHFAPPYHRLKRNSAASISSLRNAGIQAFRPLLEMEDPDWHIQIDVNLTVLRMQFAPSRLPWYGAEVAASSSLRQLKDVMARYMELRTPPPNWASSD